MVKKIKIVMSLFLIIASSLGIFGQEKSTATSDTQVKEVLYSKYKKEVLAYSKKEYDALFFEFFQKQNDNKNTLTKEEYYTYTIKIGIYAEKLGLLYKDQKAEARRTKQEWFDKAYQDYLITKK